MADQPGVRNLQGALIVSVRSGFAKGLARAIQDLPPIMQALSKSLDLNKLPASLLEDSNLTLARHAQEAIKDGWRSRLPRASVRYRAQGETKGVGRLTGLLGPALASDLMLEGTSSRVISFVNTSELSRVAAHWARVNYGAVGGNLSSDRSQEARAYTVSVNGHDIGTLRDPGKPRTTSPMPRFMWFDAEGARVAAGAPTSTDRFGPVSPTAYMQADGAAAAHFIDLGLESVAREFGPTYLTMFKAFIQEEGNRARLSRSGIDVPVDVRYTGVGFTVTTH